MAIIGVQPVLICAYSFVICVVIDMDGYISEVHEDKAKQL